LEHTVPFKEHFQEEYNPLSGTVKWSEPCESAGLLHLPVTKEYGDTAQFIPATNLCFLVTDFGRYLMLCSR